MDHSLASDWSMSGKENQLHESVGRHLRISVSTDQRGDTYQVASTSLCYAENGANARSSFPAIVTNSASECAFILRMAFPR
jgi:hypothetical protein